MSAAATPLRQFDMTKIKHNSVVVMIGMRETGKSFLVKDLLWHHKDIPTGIVVSGTEGANHFYSKVIPPTFIHEEYSPLIVADVLNRQKMLARNRTADVDPRNFLILDDCLYDSTWICDRNVRELFMNGRQLHTMFIITMLYAMGIPPVLRANIDYLFIFRENIVSNRRRLYEQYAGMFPDFDTFCQVLEQLTAENFECLVIDNTSKSNTLEDNVFWYKASERPDFQMCVPDE